MRLLASPIPTILSMAAAGTAVAMPNTMPAARVHVRYVDGAPMRFTSRLAQVVDLNFTLGWSGTEGKRTIDRYLDRIAENYSLDSSRKINVKKFMGPGGGGSGGFPNPMFTLEDLRSAEVIVTNDISGLNDLPFSSATSTSASALETVVGEGKAVLNFVLSADARGLGDWPFYSQTLIPLDFQGWNGRVIVPVYRNHAETRHLILEGVLDSGVTPMDVPMGIDSDGSERIEPKVPARSIAILPFRFRTNLLQDPRYAPISTCLLRYDPRAMGTSDFPSAYRFKGGNAFSCFWKAGEGRSAFIHLGFDPNEIQDFDDGRGDFERYFAQMLFFLAGYRAEPCGAGVDCEGLPVVDSLDHLTGETFSAVSIAFGKRKPALLPESGIPYRACLIDLRGQVVAIRTGRGNGPIDFDGSGLSPGLYFLSVRTGKSQPQVKRHLIPPANP